MSTVTATTTIGLRLEPLDVLFFRDGRPFTGSERSLSGLPMPQTFAGAIRTALLRSAGCDFRRLGETIKNEGSFADAVQRSCPQDHHWIGQVAFRGAWLARQNETGEEPEVFIPAPAVLHRRKRGEAPNLHRLNPLPAGQLPGWNPPADQQGLRPLWLRNLDATEPIDGYLTPTGLNRFLCDEAVSATDLVPQSDLFDRDYRIGIGMSPDRLVAEQSEIFGRGFLALKPHVFLYAEVSLPENDVDNSLLDILSPLPLGGEGRHVLVERLPTPFDWPSPRPVGDKHKPFVLLTTPCAFAAGWRPRDLDGHLVGAAVPSPLAYSGWDLARGGPKPTRFAVPAGSVYFFDSLSNNWLQSLAENDEDRRQGWGCCLTGVWTDE